MIPSVYLNLIGSAPGSAKTASWTAEQLAARTSLSGTIYKGSSLTLSFNGASTGAGAMDTGSTPTSSSLYVYAIYNPATATWATLGTVAGSGANVYGGTHLPTGYTASVLIWAGVTDSSGNIQAFSQHNEMIQFPKVSVYTNLTNLNTFTSKTLSAICPVNAKSFSGLGGGTSSGQTFFAVASDTFGTNVKTNISYPHTAAYGGYKATALFEKVPFLTAQAAFIQTNAAPGDFFINSYTI